jgi:hypothetical protein
MHVNESRRGNPARRVLIGSAPSSELMNARVLFPLSMLPYAVERETGHRISHEAVETMANDAWRVLRADPTLC